MSYRYDEENFEDHANGRADIEAAMREIEMQRAQDQRIVSLIIIALTVIAILGGIVGLWLAVNHITVF